MIKTNYSSPVFFPPQYLCTKTAIKFPNPFASLLSPYAHRWVRFPPEESNKTYTRGFPIAESSERTGENSHLYISSLGALSSAYGSGCCDDASRSRSDVKPAREF